MKTTKPLNPEPRRKLCPVCGEPSYPCAGIHPQCAAVQVDAKRVREAQEDAQKKAKHDGDFLSPDDLEKF